MPNTAAVGASVIRYFDDIIAVLKASPPDQQAKKVKAEVAARLLGRGEIVPENLDKQLSFARLYLAHAGLLERKPHGIWALTVVGEQYGAIDDASALTIYYQALHHKKVEQLQKELRKLDEDAYNKSPRPLYPYIHRAALQARLRDLSPSGFELLCQELLKKAGLDDVEVTGQTGDHGIDGRAVLTVASLITVQVVFQCKHYRDHTVGDAIVKDFYSAMKYAQAHYGIIFTTSSFTDAAIDCAEKIGDGRLQLVDGRKFMELLEHYELGLKCNSNYVIDSGYFAQFKQAE